METTPIFFSHSFCVIEIIFSALHSLWSFIFVYIFFPSIYFISAPAFTTTITHVAFGGSATGERLVCHRCSWEIFM